MAKATAKPRPNDPAPIVVIFGDDEFLKHDALRTAIDEALPPDCDRGMALVERDADRNVAGGGLDFAAVMDDLATLPFLATRRAVVVRNADPFITAHRARLEAYAQKPFATATLILVCRTFPATTRLAKAVAATGRVVECKRLKGPALISFVQDCARRNDKTLEHPLAAKVVELVGGDAGALANEVEKLCLLALDRDAITPDDVANLVGQTREEIVFAAMDAAAGGNLSTALKIWAQALATDRSAAFKAVGGVAWKLRAWLAAHELRSSGAPMATVAAKIGLWGRPAEAELLLRRLSHARVQRMLKQLAELDGEAKVGARSIERGVEALLVELAA